jgi:hypothetical protein
MNQVDPGTTTHELAELPVGSKLRSVTAIRAQVAGRSELGLDRPVAPD